MHVTLFSHDSNDLLTTLEEVLRAQECVVDVVDTITIDTLECASACILLSAFNARDAGLLKTIVSQHKPVLALHEAVPSILSCGLLPDLPNHIPCISLVESTPVVQEVIIKDEFQWNAFTRLFESGMRVGQLNGARRYAVNSALLYEMQVQGLDVLITKSEGVSEPVALCNKVGTVMAILDVTADREFYARVIQSMKMSIDYPVPNSTIPLFHQPNQK